MLHRFHFMLFILVVCTGWGLEARAAVSPGEFPGGDFGTPIRVDSIDREAFSQWVEGTETRVDEKFLPERVMVTATTSPTHETLYFGNTKTPGVRHLRIGLKESVAVGTVMVKDGGAVSVLKAGATYPGDMAKEEDWVKAQRIENGQLMTDEPDGTDLSLWILPLGTTTRAIRFTHTAKTVDREYRGALSGAMVVPTRLVNEAWNAVAGASANHTNAGRLINLKHDGWENWNNEEEKFADDAPVVSATNPGWVSLAWQKPVCLDGLIAIWAGMTSTDVQTYRGPESRNPKDAPDSDWETIASYKGIRHNYPTQFFPQRLDFGRQVTTRAIRLLLTAPGEERSHATNNSGRRVWLGELMAIRNLGGETLKSVEPMVSAEAAKPPVPIRFELTEAGYVSLVIEREDGVRVRNLVSETYFPAGENTAWWDCTDDLGRDPDAAEHGVYHLPPSFIQPGSYRVRGLVRGAIRPHYEFTVYTSGDPPWSTEDNTGAWLANHSPPQAAAFVPAAQSPTGKSVVFLGCYVTEGPSGVAWVDMDGKVMGGKKWVGGNWTAAPFLARDAGPQATPGVQVYVASAWNNDKNSAESELRITALTKDGDKPVIKHAMGNIDPKGPGEQTMGELGGLAAHDGVVVASLTKRNELLVVDADAGKVLNSIPVNAPRGIVFDSDGRLLVVAGKRLLRYDPTEGGKPPEVIISEGLDAPEGITLAGDGSIFISDQGASHQVKVFTGDGKFLRAIGKPGAPAAGKYDPLHMNHPHGIAVDEKLQLWVTENDYLPKRVSVWSMDGALIRAFYGPGKYGGGGSLDPQDKTKFYYADEERGSLEFKVDWERGSWILETVLFRSAGEEGGMKLPERSAAPEQAMYRDGRRYFANAFNSNPTGGHDMAHLFVDRQGLAVPAVAMGKVTRMDILKNDDFRSKWPEGMWPDKTKETDAFFIWSDLDEDGKMQPPEVNIVKGKSGGITVMPDLSFCVARLDGKAMKFSPTRFTSGGVPVYDYGQAKVLAEDVQDPRSSGGDQVLSGTDGWAVLTLGSGPFSAFSVTGTKDGVTRWSYPNVWPGLHASHNAPRPDRPGQLIGATRLLGGFFEVEGSDVGPMWAINTNHGRIAIFTQDGIFVGHAFEDMRSGINWRMPAAVRNMDLEGLSLSEENFWPSLTHSSDGKAYLVDGGRSAIVRLDGLETVRRLPDAMLNISSHDVEMCRAWQMEAELARQRTRGTGFMTVLVREVAPVVDGRLEDWPSAGWVDIDKSGVKAYFNSDAKPYDVTGSISISGGKLYAAWRTGGKNPLKNSGEMPLALFKTGDALDLMLGPPGDRKQPKAGDMRLLVTVVRDKPVALIYRASVPGTKADDKVPFSSPWRTITFDRVEDVSQHIEFAGGDGNYELSVPLDILGMKPTAGTKIRGDIGVLRGSGNQTTTRVYWSNKATGITADVPEEAMLNPGLWGELEFVAE